MTGTTVAETPLAGGTRGTGLVRPLTVGAVAAATGGVIRSGHAETPLTGVSIDSRTLTAGDLFFAIEAGRDGHDFVPDAFRSGAGGAVVRRWPLSGSSPSGPAIVQVADTTRALQDLARQVRRQSGVTVVAITGSAGKTTTKEAIAEVLGARYAVMRNPGNLNNHLGLPLSLLSLATRPAEIAVVELGMNHAGEIRQLVDVAEPNVRVWTNVGQAHVGAFASIDALADAKAEVLEGATTTDCLVCNADDPRVTERARRFPGRVVTFGFSSSATVHAADVVLRGTQGSQARVITPAGECELHLHLVGEGNLANALCAVAVGLELQVRLDEIAVRLTAMTPVRGRGSVARLHEGVTLIDDSYNSSPSALQQALEALGRDQQTGRKAAVLGEMLELGPLSLSLHQSCGRTAARAGLSRLITVGGASAAALGDAAVEAGMKRELVSHVATSQDAAAVLTDWLAAGDVVLVKGSRGTRTEVVADAIRTRFR